MTTSRYWKQEHNDGQSAVWTIVKEVFNISLMHTPEGLQKFDNMTCTYWAKNKSLRKVNQHILNGFAVDTNYSQSLDCRRIMKDMPLTSVAPSQGWESHSVQKFRFEIDAAATQRDCWCFVDSTVIYCQLPVTMWFLNGPKGCIQRRVGGDNNPSFLKDPEEGSCCLGGHETYVVLFHMLWWSGWQRWCSLKELHQSI